MERIIGRSKERFCTGNFANGGGVDEVSPCPRVVTMSDKARCLFDTLDEELLDDLRSSCGSGFTSILARIEENASKLALIRAVSRDPVDPEIVEEDAQWGILIARHCAEQTIREASTRVSENDTESNHKRALLIIKEAGAAGMTKSVFTRRTQFMDSRQRDGVLRTLLDADQIEINILPGQRRPVSLI